MYSLTFVVDALCAQHVVSHVSQSPGAGTASPVVLPAPGGNRGITAVLDVSLNCSIPPVSAVNTS